MTNDAVYELNRVYKILSGKPSKKIFTNPFKSSPAKSSPAKSVLYKSTQYTIVSEPSSIPYYRQEYLLKNSNGNTRRVSKANFDKNATIINNNKSKRERTIPSPFGRF